MTPRVRWADIAVLPALCAMVIALFAIGYTAGKLVTLRFLRENAEATVDVWRNHVTHRLGPNLSALPDDRPSHPLWSPRALDLPHHLSTVLSVDLLTPAGEEIRPDAAAPRTTYRFATVRERVVFDTAIRTGTLQYLVPDGAGPDDHRTVFYAPMSTAGTVVGALRLDIDQTAMATLLHDAFRTRMAINGPLALIAVATLLYFVWRRTRDRWRAEDEIRFLALHDTLTSLPNRAQFNVRLRRALDRARDQGTCLAVLCIDIDNFKDINDSLGHPAGDRVLRCVAERILAMSGRNATVSRLSGDEFAILLEDIEHEHEVRKTVARYLRSAQIPHEIDDSDLVCTLSIGIALAPEHGTDAETLMKNADLALYKAKADGRNTSRFFTADMEEALRRRRQIEDEMRRGLGTDQFKVHYQPQFNLRSGELIGYEALARWSNPELGDISPAVFIPIAEACGLVAPLGEWVLRTACTAAAGWAEHLKVAVNLSAIQFRMGDVADLVERTLRSSGLPAGRLEVEITETVLLHNTEAARTSLSRLRALGVSIAIDDFGTGYSSLSYLSRFPIDKIKIDRSFVQAIGRDQNTAAIIKAIIGLGNALQTVITAEGVETYEQAAFLRAAGCHQVQGFLFGAPGETVEAAIPEVVRLQHVLSRAAG